MVRASNQRENQAGSAVKIDNIDCERLKHQIDAISNNVDTILNEEDISEEDIFDSLYHDVYRVSKEMDWYCNKGYPEGRRIIRNKERIIRKAISKQLPCMDTSPLDKKMCESCRHLFKCWTTKNREYILNVINKATQKEEKLMSKRDLYEGTISESGFETLKKELGDFLNVKIK